MFNLFHIYLLLCGGFQLILFVNCAPWLKPSDETWNFMKKYGYIVDDGGQSEALYTEKGISEVIKTMQKFGGIEETGVLDNETQNLLTLPRCGVPDIIRNENKRHKRFIIASPGWNKRNLTFYIANWSSRLGEYAVVKNIQKALDTWGAYGRLSFTRTSDPRADIIVSFARGYHGDMYPFDGPNRVLAHAFFPIEGVELGGDIHFDDDENWADRRNGQGDDDSKDFYTVALHELGHSLGLAHSSVPTSIMFPYYKGYEEGSFELDYDDIMGMYSLYISRRLKDDDKPIPNVNGDPTHTTPNYEPHYPTTEQSTTFRTTTDRYERHRTTTDRSTFRTSTDRYDRTTSTMFHRHHRPTYTQDPNERLHTSTLPSTTRQRIKTTTTRNDKNTVNYDGDYESVDEHKKHDTKHKIPKTNSPSLPNICNGHFDAVATLRNELFIFKDKYIWRLREKGRIEHGYPIPLKQMFPDIPDHIKKIDAAYQGPDGNIYLFTGRDVWISDGSRFIENRPRSLSYFGLPDYLDSIDAVQTWAKNGKTYFYKNDRFWRYNETAKEIDPGYPLHMERWRGVPTHLDAATTWTDGSTYFFKNEKFWKFDNDWVIVTDNSPLPVAPIWLGCQENENMMRDFFR